jgi:multiple sugar transport system permease protein
VSRMLTPRALSQLGAYSALVVFSVWILVPIYFIVLAAFSSQDSVYAYPKDLLPTHLSTDTFSFFVHFPGTIAGLERSGIVAVLTLGVSLAVGAPAGYALARFPFRGSDAIRLTLLGTRAFPIVIIAIPLAVTFIDWGIDDTVYGVAFAHTTLALPIVVLTTASIFAGVSAELEEAAMTLGCSRLGAFRRVALPLALPGLAAASLFTLLLSWNEVFAASILTVRHRTLPALVLQNLDLAPLPYKFAGSFFLLVPSLVVIFVIRKYLFNMWGRVVK